MQDWVSRTFWSTYHDSAVVRRELAALLANIGDGQQALNIGSGESDLHSGVTNLDVDPSNQTDCVGGRLVIAF